MALDHRTEQLLNAISRHRIVPLEERTAEVTQPGLNDLGLGSPGEELVERLELEKMALLGAPFETGLRSAAQRSAQGEDELRLDAQDPAQSDMADALIQFLVRPHFATVRTDEPEPGHYVYYVAVDWAALDRFAVDAGVHLNEVVDRSPRSSLS